MPEIPSVPVTGPIRLGQFLKFASLVEDGATARMLVQEGDVLVNGEVETRRGRQLCEGDVVTLHSPAGTFSARVGAAI